MKHMREFKELFDVNILRYISTKEQELSIIDSEAAILVQIIAEFIKNGGKRIRPALFYYASTSYGGNKKDALMQSMVFEFFQTFCLIHDDIIDQSDLRRGKPTVHKQHDLPTAILSGDMALMIADELFYSFPSADAVVKTYNTFKQEVLMGEYLDSKGSHNTEKVMDLKTARYSFVRPVELGLRMANCDGKIIENWQTILHATGMVFQLKDDLMGVYGNEETIGKSASSDLAVGKYTQLIKYFTKTASESEMQIFQTYFGKETLLSSELDVLKDLLRSKDVPQKISNSILQQSRLIRSDLQKMQDVSLHSVLRDVLDGIEDMTIIRI